MSEAPPNDAANAARRLFELLGGHAMLADTFQEMATVLRDSLPVAEGFWEEIRAAIQADPELDQAVTDAYVRHLQAEDIGALVAFYASPVGRKMAAAHVAVARGLVAVSVRWQSEVFGPAVERLVDKARSS